MKRKFYPDLSRGNSRERSRRAFTLIEMLVTTGIIVIMTGVAVANLGPSTGAGNVSNASDEIKGLVDELKSYAAGPDRERAGNYVLIIQTNGGGDYCNKNVGGTKNHLNKNQYMICQTILKDISLASLDNDFNRVRAAGLNSNLTISSTVFTITNPIVINIRTYDGQTGYDLKYCDKDNVCGSPEIIVSQDTITKILTLNSVLGTLQ